MNEALMEIMGKKISYDWAALAQLAKDHVNPNQLIKDIYANGYEDGFKDGYSKGVLDGRAEMLVKIAVIGTPLIIFSGYGLRKLWDRQKEEIEKIAEENAKLKAEEFVKELERTSINEGISDNVIWGYFEFEKEYDKITK